MLLNIILVGIGGGIGTFLRAILSDTIKKIWKNSSVISTFIINVTGSFLLGVVIHYHANDIWRLFLGTGILGGYTTFSTYHYESVSLLKTGKKKKFMLYYIFSVVCGVIAAGIGIIL
ncbi:fluoride efflux transporter FluC [Anaerocolumna xylanovorans]|uniref:Fluoride-specific ion channel FluC n=1 Tax=Anaerocolumna xylanovorans DSM 12503 TaxID=1121345 RepID=A0A1M7Y1C7_9FIRM|nr:CrcB family protein [Anaerocolumna xylanovorans]SHO45591.1 camphor resistance protein CrcB [Anaerocolumna xylanovorans DSM 12503]